MKILVTGGAGFIPLFYPAFYERGMKTALSHRPSLYPFEVMM